MILRPSLRHPWTLEPKTGEQRQALTQASGTSLSRTQTSN